MRLSEVALRQKCKQYVKDMTQELELYAVIDLEFEVPVLKMLHSPANQRNNFLLLITRELMKS
jgi:hypothetical protein